MSRRVGKGVGGDGMREERWTKRHYNSSRELASSSKNENTRSNKKKELPAER
jgi:hypothetical protein